MTYDVLKALHIIFVVTWFAGLFYIVRLFVYHAEAEKKEDPEKSILQRQYKLMEKRLWYGITWPSMLLTLTFGIWMLVERPVLLKQAFMHLKLGMVFLLILYHFLNQRIFNRLQKGRIDHTPFKLRLWNEVATIFLVAIVFIITLRDLFSWVWGLLGIFIFALALYLSVRLYRRFRERSQKPMANSQKGGEQEARQE